MEETSLKNDKFIEILTNNGKNKTALENFFKTLENWGDSREKVTFYIVKSTTLKDGIEEGKETKNFTVNLAIYDVMMDVYKTEEVYEKFADMYNGKRVCLTKNRKNKKVDYEAEYNDLCSGMTVKEVGKKYDKSPATIRQHKKRFLNMREEKCDKSFNNHTDFK